MHHVQMCLMLSMLASKWRTLMYFLRSTQHQVQLYSQPLRLMSENSSSGSMWTGHFTPTSAYQAVLPSKGSTGAKGPGPEMLIVSLSTDDLPDMQSASTISCLYFRSRTLLGITACSHVYLLTDTDTKFYNIKVNGEVQTATGLCTVRPGIKTSLKYV